MNLHASNRLRFAALVACLALLGGCHKAPAAADAAAGATKQPPAAAEEGVTLSAGQVQKLGIVASPAKAASYTPEAAGYALVMAHETLAQGVADLITAQAAARQSRAALARIERLAGTPGAVPADAQEAAARQAAVDQAALELTRQRLSAALGQRPPWHDGDAAMLTALADGRIKLVRATFPSGVIDGITPASLRLERIAPERFGRGWKSTAPWVAPGDASVPGRSFFALLKDSDAAEGERLLAWTPVGQPEAGVAIPAAAVVIRDSKSWCYIERSPGHYVRSEIDTHMPLEEGYFVKTGVAVGNQVVTESAGLLLAREMNPGMAAD
jgi:hypothetical protein